MQSHVRSCAQVFVWFLCKFRAAVGDNARRRAHEEQAAARRRARDLAAPAARLRPAPLGASRRLPHTTYCTCTCTWLHHGILWGGKRVDVSSDGERSPPPIDTVEWRPASEVRCRPSRVGVWASDLIVHSVKYNANAVSHRFFVKPRCHSGLAERDSPAIMTCFVCSFSMRLRYK